MSLSSTMLRSGAAASRRLQALRAQLCAGAARFEELPLPSMPAQISFFDAERFEQEHGTVQTWDWDKDCWGPGTRPSSGDLRNPEHPEIEARNRARLVSKYQIKYEREVRDARQAPQESILLDEQGFKLYDSPTRMQPEDFYERETVEAVYLKECEEFIKRETGATRVLPFDYVVRNSNRKVQKAGQSAGPIHSAHNDHTLVSGPRRTRELLGEDAVNDEVLKHRFALMNVWRRWDGGNDEPLAVCAYQTLDYSKDMVPTDLVYRHRTGETYSVRTNPKQRFYWFSDMTKDEGILLKIYDSEKSVARGSLHTGFKNPASISDPYRESMEVRCVVLWGPKELTAKASLRNGEAATNVGGQRTGPGGHDDSKAYRE